MGSGARVTGPVAGDGVHCGGGDTGWHDRPVMGVGGFLSRRDNSGRKATRKMNTEPKPETVMPMLAVNGFKHQAFVKAQAAVIQAAMRQTYVSPGDIAEETVAKEDRQGVASNAWNTLRCLGILQRVPMSLTMERAGIFGGRIRNKNPHAKGRWCAVYSLSSRALAEAWLRANAPAALQSPAPHPRFTQPALFA